MEINKLKQELGQSYFSQCQNLNIAANKRLVVSLQEPTQEDDGTSLDFVYRGNFRLNFNSRLVDSDLIVITSVFDHCKDQLRHIDLSFNRISDLGCEVFAKLLKEAPNLESLNLQGNQIEVVGAQAIAESLKELAQIRYLNLDMNKIRTEGAMLIIEMLFQNKSLIELNIGNNEINIDGIIAITSVLNWNNTTLAVLNINNPVLDSIGQENAIHYSKMLQSNRSLEKLSIQKHVLNCDGIYQITEHLLENNKLRVLDLTANKISFKGCESLAKYLSAEYCVLESLILKSNRTGHYGAKAIAQALSKNRTLVHLDMVNNDIDDNGLKMIAESLDTNETLVSLKLYQNHFAQLALQAFHKLRLRPKKGDWFWDFYTYIVDTHIEMAYVETRIPYDIEVSMQYYI